MSEREVPSSARCLRRVLAPLEVREALDVGCGSGSFTRTLTEQLGSVRAVLGIDPDKDSVDEARRLTDDRRIRYRVSSLAEVAFGERRFDLVAISNALHHLTDPPQALSRMRELVRDPAWLVVQELICDELRPSERNGRDVHHFKARIDRLNGRVHHPTFTRAQVHALVEESGAVAEESCEVTDPSIERGELDTERAAEAIAFLAEYVDFARETDQHAELRAEADRIGASIASHGIATPPRLLIRARFRF